MERGLAALLVVVDHVGMAGGGSAAVRQGMRAAAAFVLEGEREKRELRLALIQRKEVGESGSKQLCGTRLSGTRVQELPERQQR